LRKAIIGIFSLRTTQQYLRRDYRLSLAGILAIVALPACLSTARAQQTPAIPAVLATSAASERALLDQYCVTCHNQRLKTAGLTLDLLDVARIQDHADVWEKVVR